MRLQEIANIKETASAGASSAGAIAGVSMPLGSAPGFGDNYAASIYDQIKKHRRTRKKSNKRTKINEQVIKILGSKSGSVELDIPATQLITPDKKDQTLLWIFHPDFGLLVAKGKYADHQYLEDFLFRQLKRSINFDLVDRGYITASPEYKILIVCPTDVREFYSYLPKLKAAFKKEFPGWLIKFSDKYIKEIFNVNLKPIIARVIRKIININANITFSDQPPVNISLFKNIFEQQLAKSWVAGVTVKKEPGQNALIIQSYTERYRVTLLKKITPQLKSTDFVITPLAFKAGIEESAHNKVLTPGTKVRVIVKSVNGTVVRADDRNPGYYYINVQSPLERNKQDVFRFHKNDLIIAQDII